MSQVEQREQKLPGVRNIMAQPEPDDDAWLNSTPNDCPVAHETTPDFGPTIFCILEAVVNSSLPILGSSTRDRRYRRLTSSAVVKQLHSPQKGSDLNLLGSRIHLQFQAQDSTTFRPLVAKIVKRLEPFTSSVVLLIQQVSDSKQFILKLNDRRLGHRHSLKMEDGELPWTPALEEHLRAAVRDIQLGTVTNWFELVKDSMNPARPRPRDLGK
ncbi:hypothetical protein DFS33DRAFT_1400098 [Desarmillaria ectypa]|nr:hypothetical protein DFS33DRAFT_1400098 [Desarmillaria ectypa]